LPFILSLLFIGLGEIYSSKASQGIIFFLSRSFLLIFAPIYLSLSNSTNSFYIFLIVIAIICTLSLFSPIYAIHLFRKSKGKQKSYNKKIVYSFFAIVNIIITATFTIFMASQIKIIKIKKTAISPLISKGDFILTISNNYNIRKGEMIVYQKNKKIDIGRVIAIGKNSISIKNDFFAINRTPLPIKNLTDSENRILQPLNTENIIIECNNKRRYPLQINVNPKKIQKEVTINLNEKEILVAKDNRNNNNFYTIIKQKNIKSKIKGIIYSKIKGKYLIKDFFLILN